MKTFLDYLAEAEGSHPTDDENSEHALPKTDEKTMHDEHDAVHAGSVYRSRDVGGYDRVYHMNRIMMAMAKADGKSTGPVDSPSETWYEKYNTMHPYTKEEDKMVQAAMNTVPTDGKRASSDDKSREPDFVHRTSPHRNPGPIKLRK